MKKSSLLQILPCNHNILKSSRLHSVTKSQNKKSNILDDDRGDSNHCTPMIFTAFPSPCICDKRF